MCRYSIIGRMFPFLARVFEGTMGRCLQIVHAPSTPCSRVLIRSRRGIQLVRVVWAKLPRMILKLSIHHTLILLKLEKLA